MSKNNKRYYWLKLPKDFFADKRIKRLRRLAGGDTYTIIYQKMLLASLDDGGKLYFEGVEENFAAELALMIDEKEDDVAVTLSFLEKQGMIELLEADEGEYMLTELPALIGSETASARRMRRLRSKKDETTPSLSDANVTPAFADVQNSDIEKEIDIDIDIDIELDTDIDKECESGADAPPHTRDKPKPRPPKKKYGEYGWVLLTEAQYAKLLKDLGAKELERCIRYVDESAQSSGNKNKWKDWNLVIRRCSRDGWGLRGYSNTRASPGNRQVDRVKTEAEYDLDDEYSVQVIPPE